MDERRFIDNLKRRGYQVAVFDTGAEAAAYLNEAIDGRTVGFGDSETMLSMGLYEKLAAHNEVHDPMHRPEGESFRETARKTLLTDVFLTSLNAMSETGELVNIDGTGNRVAGSLFGHEKVYFVVSLSKLCPTLDDAIFRARNVAAPLNAAQKIPKLLTGIFDTSTAFGRFMDNVFATYFGATFSFKKRLRASNHSAG